MNIPIYNREFYSFISHAHVDRKIAGEIENWLTIKAGISVWSDVNYFQSGMKSMPKLEGIFEQCKSVIILLSKRSVDAGWVKDEFDACHDQRVRYSNSFRIISIKTEECEVPTFLEETRLVDMSKSGFDVNAANEILLSLHAADPISEISSRRDIYISYSRDEFSENRTLLINTVFQVARQLKFRLIGDAPDQNGQSKSNLIQKIVSSCGGLVAILSDSQDEKRLGNILEEMGIANNMDMPYIVVAAQKTAEISEKISQKAAGIVYLNESDIHDKESLTKLIYPIILNLTKQWRIPRNPQYVFYGTGLREENKDRSQLVKRLIQRITIMPCLMGEDIREGHIQQQIVKRVSGAFVMIADVSQENLNTCIEAGIAMGAKVPLHLVAGGPRHKPPFMFRDQQIWHYDNDMELLGIVHNLVLPYRRHIIDYDIESESSL